MHHLYLDPLLLACPRPSEGQEGFDSFLQGLLLLRDLRDSSWARLLISESTCDILFKTNCYPMRDDLHNVISIYGNNEIQVKDVIELVNGLLERAPTLEGYSGINEALFDGLICSPAVELSNRNELFQEGFERLIFFAALVGNLNSIPANKQISIVRNIEALPAIIDVQASLHDFDGDVNITLPYKVSGTCSICRNWDELHAFLNYEQLWVEANTNSASEHALKTNVWSVARIRGIPKQRQLKWTFGSRFLESASSFGFLHDLTRVRMLLRACAETILQEDMRSTHALRTGRGANNTQVLRGTDKAWRRDIDHEFHIHYWETSDGIEFSCVVPHNDFDIIS